MDWQATCAALEDGTPLLTANQRLSREWRRRYDAWQRERGRTVWPSADVLPLGAWVRRAFEATLDEGVLGLGAAPAEGAGGTPGAAPIVLSEHQARLVWERIVADSALARGVLRSHALAASARRAWQMLSQWRLDPPPAQAGQPLEERAFAEWAAAYRTLCDRQGWRDAARLSDAVADALASGRLRPPERVLLAGFDERPPQVEALLAALSRAGCAVEALPDPALAREARRTEAPDAEREAWLAARWARHWLEREPGTRVSLVVPDLTARRAQVVRVLEDVLQPDAALAGRETAERPFNVSQGQALADYPLVATALRLLALRPERQPLEDWSALLRSPFLAGAESEREARGRLDVRLRDWGAAELPAASVQAAARASDGPACPRLAQALTAWRRAWDALPARQAPAAWALAFDGLLRALGWPGERSLDTAEFQTLEHWRGLLEELARLEPVAPVLTRAEALAALGRAAADTDFQPEGAEASVQVLGLLEAGGLAFDHLWVLGLHEEQWPPPLRPSPLLPTDLQRRAGLPHASLARELERARRVTERLRQAAPDVVFSHPAADGERRLRVSPLVAPLPFVAAEALPASAAPTLRDVLGAATQLEPHLDEQAPPIAPAGAVSGGTGLFQDQAACPFRAFAHHRLQARAPASAQPGLDAAAQGTLVHLALERAWRELRDHAALCALDAAGEQALLAEAVQGALVAYAETHPHPHQLGSRGRALEQRRLLALLADWLACERARTPFAVEQVEQRTPLEIGGVSFTGRMDRMDRLPDGRLLLIDYKTGRVHGGAWWGARPDEPQLPLYATSAGEALAADLAGVAFAQVSRRKLGFTGVADDPARFPGARRFDALRLPPGQAPFDSFAAVVAAWRDSLEGLAAHFRGGDARVDPKRPDTCQRCDLPGLCRIAELRPAYALAAEDAGDDDRTDEGSP